MSRTRRIGFWMDVQAWLDDDGKHIILAHECAEGRDVSMLPYPRWRAEGGKVEPSFHCGRCGVHTRVDLTSGPAPGLVHGSSATARAFTTEEDR